MTLNEDSALKNVNPVMPHLMLNPNSTLARAYLLMERHDCDALPVTSEGEIVGVVTLRDITQLIQGYTEGLAVQAVLKVGNYMRSPIGSIDVDHDLARGITLMLDERVYAFAVKKGDALVGILSREHLLLLLADLCAKAQTRVLDTFEALKFKNSFFQ